MILIASADYCNEAISAEIGQIPPTFLPIGIKRLFELQSEILQQFDEEVWLSLPEGFEVSEVDEREFNDLNWKLIFVPRHFSLSESLAFCIEKINPTSHLRLLLGDTYYDNLPRETCDLIAVATAIDDNKWGRLSHRFRSENLIITGYFCFLLTGKFQQCLKKNPKDFIAALEDYCLQTKVLMKEIKDWQDFGHRNLYFRTKTKHLLPRSFNKLAIYDGFLVKSSADIEKITAEYNWFKNLPLRLTIHTPKIVSNLKIKGDEAKYEIEIIPSFSLSEMLVFGRNSEIFWNNMFSHLKNILAKFYVESNSFKRKKIDEADLIHIHSSLYLDKTMKRIGLQESTTGQDLSEYKKIAEEVSNYIPNTSERHLTFSHGDFCFSNVLYNSHNDRIYLIDPKGSSSLRCNPLAGDIRYDISKLFHSLVGGYDHIIANQFVINGEEIMFSNMGGEKMNKHQENFMHLIVPDNLKISYTEILAINVLLFISMVPLHDDAKEKQKAFLLNARRLYKMLKEKV